MDDGYEHKKTEHIQIARSSGSFEEAVKEYQAEEAAKKKKKYEEMMKLKEERIKAAEDYKAKLDAERKEKIESGEIEASNSAPQSANQKGANPADVIAAKN